MDVKNILSIDGNVDYYGKIINSEQANYYMNSLLKNIEWKFDELNIFGKKIITKRQIAWYGDSNFKYTYSNSTKDALLWTKELFELKNLVQSITNQEFNSCLLNLYHNGEQGMSWHSDDEKELRPDGYIASLSLGAERKFVFKHKTNNEKVSLILENGSLLLMGGKVQKYWLHSLPKSKIITEPRINLTFRYILSK